MTLEEVGVVGAGLMGSGIALNFALAGYDTIVCDLSDELLQSSQKRIAAALALFVDERLIDQSQADAAGARLITTADVGELAQQCDFVTEAIVERLADKQQLFRLLDESCPDHTVIVSNTSGLTLSDIGDGVRYQERLGLTHYFVPPHIVPGVEIAKGPGTSDETFQLLYDLMKRIGQKESPAPRISSWGLRARSVSACRSMGRSGTTTTRGHGAGRTIFWTN
jgi:3-hydroxybutyryl-CoA dehydrogenase